MLINKGFKRKHEIDDRLPPGQYRTYDFPVLSLGPTPKIELKDWEFSVEGFAEKISWNWEEFNKLPKISMLKDIHCVTKWSKFDTDWEGVSMDEIMRLAKVTDSATHIVAHSYDGYTTNLRIEDIRGGKAMIATAYDGEPIAPEHGGPARLFVPHLYFWKSAKWLNKIVFTDEDQPGFWETRGYNNYGDPWKEERYTYD